MKTALKLFLALVLLLPGAALFARGTQAGGTGPAMAQGGGRYQESPLLAARVTAGQLPPVEDRIPDVPYVWQVPQVGKYGGTLHTFNVNVRAWGDGGEQPTYAQMIRPMPDGTIVGETAESYEWSADGNSLTWHLRRGLRWSDGDPVTTEDWIFAREGIHTRQGMPTWGAATAGANVKALVALDDYTLRVDYNRAYPNTILSYNGYGSTEWGAVMPAHYFKPYHGDYSADANAKAKTRGFDTWEAFIAWSFPPGAGGSPNDLERPSIFPFLLTSVGGDVKQYERNPYYYSVDQAGNQLPYIDNIVMQVVNAETYHLKVASGEADFAAMNTSLDNYTLYKENERAGDYKVTLVPGITPNPSFGTMTFNLFNPDPVKGPILNDVRFRRAMSLAIDREEINDVVFQGVGEVRQPYPDAPYANPFVDTKYDPATANTLLDQMGLKKGSDGFRTGSNGQPFTIIIEHPESNPNVYFLVEEYWEAVGIKTEVVFEELGLFRARRQANPQVWDIMAQGNGTLTETQNWQSVGGFGISVLFWQPWSLWLDAYWAINVDKTTTLDAAPYNGVMPGIEPPTWVKQIREAAILGNRAAFRSPDYNKYKKQLWDLHAQYLMIIGTVGKLPQVQITSNKLANTFTEFPPIAEPPFNLNLQLVQAYFK
jgi:peptide/nickel transport system substrate-binding protein